MNDLSNIKMDNKLIVSALIIFVLIIVGVRQYEIDEKLKKEDKEPEIKEKVVETTDIKIIINDKEYSAKFYENETTKELMEKLPLELEMTELNGNEKYYNFDEKFKSTPMDVDKINKGDIMLFGDNCLVLFYKTFDSNNAYTKLGFINNPDELELDNDNITIKIEK